MISAEKSFLEPNGLNKIKTYENWIQRGNVFYTLDLILVSHFDVQYQNFTLRPSLDRAHPSIFYFQTSDILLPLIIDQVCTFHFVLTLFVILFIFIHRKGIHVNSHFNDVIIYSISCESHQNRLHSLFSFSHV